MHKKRIFCQIMFILLFCLPHSRIFASGGIIQDKTPLDVSLASFTYNSYYIDVPSGAIGLTVTITNASQDVDLFMKYEAPFTEETYDELEMNSDFSSVEFDTSDEFIEITPETFPPILEGRWFIAAFNFSGTTANFMLTATLESAGGTSGGDSLPLPTSPVAFAMYDPIEEPHKSIQPSEAGPIGVGSCAIGGDNVRLHINLGKFSGPADVYVALYAPDIAPSIYVFTPDSFLQPVYDGIVSWKENIIGPIDEILIEDIPTSHLPEGTYYLGVMVTPAENIQSYYFWTTYFTIFDDPGKVPDGSASFSQGTLQAPNATILYKGEQYEESAPIASNDLAVIIKDGKTYLYHPALGKVELSEETSRRSVGYFIFGVSADDKTPNIRHVLSVPPNKGNTLEPSQSKELATGVFIDRDGRLNAEAKNRVYSWSAIKTSTGEGPYFISPAGRIIDNNVLRLLNNKLDLQLGALSNTNSVTFALEKGTVETYRAIWRLFPWMFENLARENLADLVSGVLTTGQTPPNAKAIPGSDLRLAKDPQLSQQLDELDMTLQILEFVKCIASVADFTEVAEIFTNAAFNLAQAIYADWKTGKQFLVPGSPAYRNYLKTFLQDLANDVPTAVINTGTAEATSPLFTFLDILGTLSFAYENASDANKWAYDEIEFVVREDVLNKFLRALHSAHYLNVGIVGDHKFVNADGTPAESIHHFSKFAAVFSVVIYETDMNWKNDTQFNAYFRLLDETYTVNGTVNLLSTGPKLEIKFESTYQDQKSDLNYATTKFTISGVPFDMDRVKYFTESPGDELPYWNNIEIFVPGSVLDTRHYISNMEHHYHYGDYWNGPIDQYYKRTEWTKPNYGLVIEFVNLVNQ